MAGLEGVDWFGVSSLIAALFFGSLSIYFYWQLRRTKTTLYSSRSANVVGNVPSRFTKLAVKYDNEDIPALSISKVAFWNKGPATIDSEDIPPGTPFRLTLPEQFRFLDGDVIAQVDPDGNRFTISKSSRKNEMIIHFDYMDPSEGAAFEVLHTARTGDSLRVAGKGKGVPNPRRLEETAYERLANALPALLFLAAIALTLVAVNVLPKPTGEWAEVAPFVEITPLVILAFAAMRLSRRGPGIPEKLRVIESKS